MGTYDERANFERLYRDMHPVFATHADLLQREVLDVAEYIDRIMVILQNETAEFTEFLKTCPLIDQETEIKKLQLIWQSQMVERKTKFIESGFRQLLEEDCQKCLRRCFALLQYTSKGDKMPNMFGEFISRQAFLAMSTLSGNDQSDFHPFVSKLIAFRQHFSHLTVVSFKRDNAMCKALTKAFHDVLQNSEDPSLARGPKLVALYWDHSLRKKNSLTDATKELSESLKLCAASFGVAPYIEEHIKLLFYRLVNDCCYHYTLEAMVIKVLLAGLNADNDALMQRGLRAIQDLSIKYRLNEMYQRYKEACCRMEKLIPTSLTLIHENLWAHVFVMHYKSTCVLPAFCEKSIAHFEKFFATKLIKRRIKWAHHLSTAVVAVNMSAGSCEVRVSLFGVAILFCFQKRDTLALKTIREEIMLKPLVLLEEVKLLISHGILQTNPTTVLSMDSILTLNKNFPVERGDIESKLYQKYSLLALQKAQRIAECKLVSRKRHMELHHPKDVIPSLPGALASACNVACATTPADQPFTCTHGSAPVVFNVSAQTPKTPKATEQKPEAKKAVKILVFTKNTKDIEKSPETVLTAKCEPTQPNDGRLFYEAISDMDKILNDSMIRSGDFPQECHPIHKAMMSCLNKVPSLLENATVQDKTLVESKLLDKNKEQDEIKKSDKTTDSVETKNSQSTNNAKIPSVKEAILKVSQGAIAKTSHGANLKVPKQANIQCRETPNKPLENHTEEDLCIREWENLPLVTTIENSSVKERVKRAVEEAVDIAEKHYLTQSDEHMPVFGSFGMLLDAIPDTSDFIEEDNHVFKSYKEKLVKELALTDDLFGLLDELCSDEEDEDTKEERDNTKKFTVHPKISNNNDEITRFHVVIQDSALNTTALDDLPGYQPSTSKAKRKIRQNLNRKEKQNQNSPTAAHRETGTSTIAPPSIDSQPSGAHDSKAQLQTTTKSNKIKPRTETKTSLAESFIEREETQADICIASKTTKTTQTELCTMSKATQVKPYTANKDTQTGPYNQKEATLAEPSNESEPAYNSRAPIIVGYSRMARRKKQTRWSSRSKYFNEISRESELEQRWEQLKLKEILQGASCPNKESDKEACNRAALTQDLVNPMTIDELNHLMASVFSEENQDVPAEEDQFTSEEEEGGAVEVKEFSSNESKTEKAEKMSATAKIQPQKKMQAAEEMLAKEKIPAVDPKTSPSKVVVPAPPSESLTVQVVPPNPAPRGSLITDLTDQGVEPVDGSDTVEVNKSSDSSTLAEGLPVQDSSQLSQRSELTSSIFEEIFGSGKNSTKTAGGDRANKDPTPQRVFSLTKGSPSSKISTTATTSSPTQSSTLPKGTRSTSVCNAKKGSKKSSTSLKICSCMKASCLSSSQASEDTSVASSTAKGASSVPGKSTSTCGSAAGGSTTEAGQPGHVCEETPCPAVRLQHRVQHPRVKEIKKRRK